MSFRMPRIGVLTALAIALMSAPGCVYMNVTIPLDTDLDETRLGDKVGDAGLLRGSRGPFGHGACGPSVGFTSTGTDQSPCFSFSFATSAMHFSITPTSEAPRGYPT